MVCDICTSRGGVQILSLWVLNSRKGKYNLLVLEKLSYGFYRPCQQNCCPSLCTRYFDRYDLLEFYFLQVMWGEFDKFLDEVEKGNHRRFNHSLVLKWDICKSVLQVILGIAILTLCADPIMDNIIRLASAIGVPSFFLSFVIVPLAINVCTAITAVTLLSSANQQSGTTFFFDIF